MRGLGVVIRLLVTGTAPRTAAISSLISESLVISSAAAYSALIFAEDKSSPRFISSIAPGGAFNYQSAAQNHFRSFSSSSSSDPSNIVSIESEQQFTDSLRKVQDESLPAIFYFTAVWCGPCRLLSPVIGQLCEKYPHVTTYKIDIDKEELGNELSKLNIHSVQHIKLRSRGIEDGRMPSSATAIGTLLGLGTQMYSNALRKLPYKRRSFHGDPSQMLLNYKNVMHLEMPSMVGTRVAFSSEASMVEIDSSDAQTAKKVYEKMLKYVSEIRTAPPNAWLWSLVAKCGTQEDIKLLFDILERLRRFRLSNLRIPDNFNSALCRDVTKACVRVGAIDFGKKALWKHNLYGLTPDIGSAHFLLLHAKQHNDVKLMVEVMKLVKKNELPLQPGTADIVFSICYSAGRWGLISKYGRRFVKSGVSLRQTSFDLWMEFAARKGDTESLWEIEKWRSESMKQHSLSTGFSCAKGLLLDHKPESAAAVIQAINQSTSDTKRTVFVVELQKLVSEWPLEVIKHQKEDNKKAFAAALQNDISTLITVLPSVGVATNLIVEDLIVEGVLS